MRKINFPFFPVSASSLNSQTFFLCVVAGRNHVSQKRRREEAPLDLSAKLYKQSSSSSDAPCGVSCM